MLTQPFGSRLAQDASERVPSVIRMFHGVSCCLVCSGLHARYTDTFNGSEQFLFRHEQCELVRVRVKVVLLLCRSLVVALDTARSGEVLSFVCNYGDQDLKGT